MLALALVVVLSVILPGRRHPATAHAHRGPVVEPAGEICGATT